MTKQKEKPEWVRIAEEYEASGLTQREFAERRSLKLSTLQAWVYRRRRQASPEPEATLRLLPVQVREVPAQQASDSLDVFLASGGRVRFAAGTDVEYVARLVAALEREAC